MWYLRLLRRRSLPELLICCGFQTQSCNLHVGEERAGEERPSDACMLFCKVKSCGRPSPWKGSQHQGFELTDPVSPLWLMPQVVSKQHSASMLISSWAWSWPPWCISRPWCLPRCPDLYQLIMAVMMRGTDQTSWGVLVKRVCSVQNLQIHTWV